MNNVHHGRLPVRPDILHASLLELLLQLKLLLYTTGVYQPVL